MAEACTPPSGADGLEPPFRISPAPGRPALYVTALLLGVSVHFAGTAAQQKRTAVTAVQQLNGRAAALRKAGRHEQALALHRATLAFAASAVGEASVVFVEGLGELAATQAACWRWLEAARTRQRRAELWRSVPFSSDKVADDLALAAQLYTTCRCLGRAQEPLTLAHEVVRTAPAVGDVSLLGVHLATARWCLSAGDFPGARLRFAAAGEVLARMGLSGDVRLRHVDAPLATIEGFTGELATAVDGLDRAVQGLDRNGAGWETNDVRTDLAEALIRLGDLGAARSTIGEALNEAPAMTAHGTGILVAIHCARARFELLSGRYGEAREASSRAVAAARSCLAPGCVFAGSKLADNAEVLVKAGVAASLDPVLERISALEYRLCGQSGSWAAMRMALGLARLEKRPEEARGLLEEALSVMESPPVRMRLEAIRCRRMLALANELLLDRVAARSLMARALADAGSIYGASHPITRELSSPLLPDQR